MENQMDEVSNIGKLLVNYARREKKIKEGEIDRDEWIGVCYQREFEDYVGTHYK